MKTKQTGTDRGKLTRAKRLARRFKGVLRCDWCNRWSQVPMKRWYKLFKEEKLFPAQYEYFCQRAQCKMERTHCLDSIERVPPKNPPRIPETPAG